MTVKGCSLPRCAFMRRPTFWSSTREGLRQFTPSESIEPKTLRCEAFTVLSGSGVFQRGDLTADHALIADHALLRRVEAAALAVPVAGQATPARGARRKVSFADAQSGGPEGSAGRDSKENKGRAPQPVAEGAGREEKALRLSKDAMELAHLRLGHASKQRIIELAKSGAVQGFSLQTISREG